MHNNELPTKGEGIKIKQGSRHFRTLLFTAMGRNRRKGRNFL